MTKKKVIILAFILETLYLLWVAFWPTVVAMRFMKTLLFFTVVAFLVAFWEEKKKNEEEPLELADWNAAFSLEPEKRERKSKVIWGILGIISILALLVTALQPVNQHADYSKHMPELLREELIELHGPEGQASEPVGTFTFDTVTIYVYEERYYTADRYEEEGLRGLVPRFNDNGKYSCRVEVIRYAKEKYTAKWFGREEEFLYYDATITDSGKTAAIQVRSQDVKARVDAEFMPMEEFAKQAYQEFNEYRGIR